jgi:AraC-like DNA-binding protein
MSQRLGTIASCNGLITRLACARAQSCGIDLSPLLRRIDLTLREINDEDIPLSVATQISCLNLIAAAVDDKLLGFHIARTIEPGKVGLLHYIVASADTLGDALLKLSRYSKIANEGITLKAEVGKKLRIGFDYAGVSRLSDRHQIEAWIAALVRFCRAATARELQPISVQVRHQRIRESDEFDRFFGLTVEFGTDKDDVQFPSEAAKLQIVSADPHLNKLLSKYCDEVLAARKVPPVPLRVNVENLIATLLPHGQARRDVVAQKLGLSPRSLGRKLSAEGISFARILEELRIGLAKRYLSERDLSISRIAWLLGYTEVSAFSHAFRRWTGRAPRADRSWRRSPSPVLTRKGRTPVLE